MRLVMLGAALFAVALASPATAGDHGGKGERLVPKRIFCPRCAAPCEPTVSKGTETKTCWEVETKTICIPRITFPWENRGRCKGDCAAKGGKGKCGDVNCTPAKCGRTKCVNVLMKHEYECAVCKYNWEPQKHGGAKAKANPTPSPAVPPPPAVEARFRRQAASERRVSAEQTRESNVSSIHAIFEQSR